MKRLLFSDIHFHTWSYGATVSESGMNSRLEGQYKAAMEMVEYASEHGIRYAYFLGDLFHTHAQIPTQALWCASHIFSAPREQGIFVRSIYGNHDMASRDGRFNSLEFLRRHNYEMPPYPTEANPAPKAQDYYWVDDQLKVMGVPYTNDEDLLKRCFDYADKQQEKMVMLLHQGVAGVPLSSGILLDERLSPEMIPANVIAFTGHYHFHKRVTDNLTVVGNLAPINWNDVDQKKGWVTFDDETGEIEQIIQQSAPEFRLVGRDNSECRNAFVRYCDAVGGAEAEEIRTRLLKDGALGVEFPEAREEGEARSFKTPTGAETTLQHLIKIYEAEQEPRRQEVGVMVREGKYEAPEVSL